MVEFDLNPFIAKLEIHAKTFRSTVFTHMYYAVLHGNVQRIKTGLNLAFQIWSHTLYYWATLFKQNIAIIKYKRKRISQYRLFYITKYLIE